VHTNEHAVEIDAPAARVFPYLLESEKRLLWMGALVESEQLTNGPVEAGTVWRDVFEELGQRVELEAELKELQPGRRLQIRLDGPGFEATSTQELEEQSGRTSLQTTIETEYTSVAARLLSPLVTRHAQKQLEADHARLKELVEREAEPSGWA
jgi:uncharacterized protein YndB with AHSA1/START domain